MTEPTNYRVVPPSRPISRQLRLFAPVGMRKKPHQRSLEEFANMPKTMFHGTMENPLRTSYRKGGFHVGTRRAAEDRVAQTRSGDWGYDDDYHVHPVRIKPEVERTMGWTRDQIKDWEQGHHRSFYRNKFEDPGSTSAVLKSTRDVRTYTQHAEDAIKRGGIPSAEAEYHLQQRQRTGQEPTLRPSWLPERLTHSPFQSQGELFHGVDRPDTPYQTPLHVNPLAAAPEHEVEAQLWLPRWAEQQERMQEAKKARLSRQFSG